VSHVGQPTERPQKVVDNVLKEPNQPDVVLYNRARVSFSSCSVSRVQLKCLQIGLAPDGSNLQSNGT
jgi:hypothetical protein